MNPPCARCSKTVYPTEKLNCLDKTWHKGCFKCQECNMTLNMKNYKGYNKLPYCNAHYPSTSFTAVADTPENRRLAKNTRNQSNIKYHEDFEKMKGTKTDVADDPETLRAMKNMRQMSDLEYKGHRQLSADMEARRGQGERDDVPQMPQMPRAPAAPTNDFKSPYSARNQPGMSTSYTQQGKEPARGGQRVGSISDYDPMNDQWGSVTGQPYSGGQQFTETVAAPGQQRYQQPPVEQSYQPPPQQQAPQQPPANNYRPSGHGPVNNGQAPLVPINQPLNLMVHHSKEPGYTGPPSGYTAPPSQPQQPPPSAGVGGKPNLKFTAMYDYVAADDDEVSFVEGDIIVNAEIIDEGWMTGVVQRTGESGMLPSNYVEPM